MYYWSHGIPQNIIVHETETNELTVGTGATSVRKHAKHGLRGSSIVRLEVWTKAVKHGLRGSSIDRSEVWMKTMSQSWWRLTKQSTIIVNTIQACGVLDTGCLAQLKGSRGSVFLLEYMIAKQTLCMPSSCQVRMLFLENSFLPTSTNSSSAMPYVTLTSSPVS